MCQIHFFIQSVRDRLLANRLLADPSAAWPAQPPLGLHQRQPADHGDPPAAHLGGREDRDVVLHDHTQQRPP